MSKLSMKLTIVAILLLCAALSMGCLEEKQAYVQEMDEKYEEIIPIPEFNLEVTQVQSTGTGYTRVVYTIENTGKIPVTWLKASVYLKDADGKITAVETCYPSDYPEYGLKPGQILYADRLFDEHQSRGCEFGGIKIVDYQI